MKKTLLFAFSVLFVIVSYAQSVSYNFNDFPSDGTSIVYSSGDAFYFEQPTSRSTSNLCNVSGAERRVQQNHIIIYRPSNSLGSVTIAANSSSGSGVSRTVSSIATGDSNTTSSWTAIDGWSATPLPTGTNADTTCGEIEITGLNIEADTYVRIEFTSWDGEEPGDDPQNVRLIEVTLTNASVGSGLNNSFDNYGIYFNGSEIINAEGLALEVYNTLGKLVRTSNSNINVSDLQSGIYVVRAEGVKGALKINK